LIRQPTSADRIDAKQQNLYLWDMEVHLDQHLEAQLNELAMKTGRRTEELVQQAVSRMLEYDTGFLLQT
jgi:hypothetical protein